MPDQESSTPDGDPATTTPDEIRRLSAVRRVVARRMTETWRTVPAVTLHRTVQFEALLALRAASQEQDGGRIPVDALLAWAVARSLREHRILNSSWLEDQQAVAIHRAVNVAIAVDTPHGLTAVVLRDADTRTPAELGKTLTEMVTRARDRRSLQADVAGATFTITNLGALGVDQFTPIITPPQAAVLGIGRIAGSGADERVAHVSLTFDHRITDGADAARFLITFADRLADLSLG